MSERLTVAIVGGGIGGLAAAQGSLEIWDGPCLPGYDLASRLAGIRPGNADWPAYEKYCEDLLSFLFVPPLNL